MVTTMKKKMVLFICSFSSVRSQMAEGFLNARCKDIHTVKRLVRTGWRIGLLQSP
jgi:hypothetical protein